MDKELGKQIIALRQSIVANFNAGHWEEVGLLSGHSETIDNHPRLLRSLSWGDEDYAGNVLAVLRQIAEEDPKAFHVIEQFVQQKFPGDSEYISAKPAERRITFAPSVFSVPDMPLETDLVVVMMPFSAEFAPVYVAIGNACKTADLRCLRVDDIWEDSIIIQDIFSLIFRAHIVVVDFTGKNPNVMYETGIAHTLGKHVVPISQSLSDVPFDLTHHRILKYLPNSQGLTALQTALTTRLRQVSP
jgi:AbiJ N-terminal domain 5